MRWPSVGGVLKATLWVLGTIVGLNVIAGLLL